MTNLILLLSEHGKRDVGQVTVRVLALVLALLAVLTGAIFAKSAGVYFCFGAAVLFVLAAAFPRGFGQIVGGLILFVALVIALTGPNGEFGLNSYGFVRAIPLYLLGAMFVRPDLITMATRLFSPRD